jgi:hypothetical protein
LTVTLAVPDPSVRVSTFQLAPLGEIATSDSVEGGVVEVEVEEVPPAPAPPAWLPAAALEPPVVPPLLAVVPVDVLPPVPPPVELDVLVLAVVPVLPPVPPPVELVVLCSFEEPPVELDDEPPLEALDELLLLEEPPLAVLDEPPLLEEPPDETDPLLLLPPEPPSDEPEPPPPELQAAAKSARQMLGISVRGLFISQPPCEREHGRRCAAMQLEAVFCLVCRSERSPIFSTISQAH